MSDQWLTSDEAATYGRVSVNTIRDAAERGDLSGVKVKPNSQRSRWRFLASDVDAWLEMGRVTGVRQPKRRRGSAA